MGHYTSITDRWQIAQWNGVHFNSSLIISLTIGLTINEMRHIIKKFIRFSAGRAQSGQRMCTSWKCDV